MCASHSVSLTLPLGVSLVKRYAFSGISFQQHRLGTYSVYRLCFKTEVAIFPRIQMVYLLVSLVVV